MSASRAALSRLLVRVLPAADRRGRAQSRARPGGALAPEPDVRLGHLRCGRQRRPERKTVDIVLDQGRARPRGDGALHLRRRHGRGAARDARPDARRGHRERARPARRPAPGPDRLDGDRGRPRVLAPADRADPRGLRLRDRRGLLPRGPHPRPVGARATCATARRRSTPARASSSRSCSSTTRCTGSSSPGRATPASTSRSSRASCRSPTSSRSSASRACAAPRSPTGC